MGNREKYQPIAEAAAKKYGLPVDLFLRQINQESGWNPKAGSSAGAQGIAQIMPATARSWGVDPSDPVASLDAAAKNMASYVKTYKRQGLDDTEAYARGLAAYNAGPGNVQKYGGVPPFKETQNYVKVIMGKESPKMTQSTITDLGNPGTYIPAQVSGFEGPPPLGATLAESAKRINEGLPFVTPMKPIEITPGKIVGARQGQIKTEQVNTQDDSVFQNMLKLSEEINTTVKPEPPKPQKSPLEVFGGRAVSKFTGNIVGDDLAQQDSGINQWAGIAGDIAGSIGAIGAGGLIGTALGGPVGGIAGGIAAAGGLGVGSELQRQRVTGEQQDLGKALGIGAIEAGAQAVPIVGQGLKPLLRAGANAALQGGLAGLGTAAQQVITGQPIDLNQIGMGSLIGASGGTLGGLAGGRGKAIELPKGKPVEMVPASMQVSQPVERVRFQTPSPRFNPEAYQQAVQQAQMPQAIDLTPQTPVKTKVEGQIVPQSMRVPQEMVQPPVINVAEKVVEDMEGLPQAKYVVTAPDAIPEKPQVQPVEYATTVAEKKKITGVDAALYDAAQGNPVAKQKVREALPGYGEESLDNLARTVKATVDDIAIDGNPEGVTQRLLAPKVKPEDKVLDFAPEPMSLAKVVNNSRRLQGSRDEMIAQGLDGTLFRTRDDFTAMQERLKGLGDIKTAKTKFEMITPEYIAQNAQNIVDNVSLLPNAADNNALQTALRTTQKYLDKFNAGTIKESELANLQKRIAELDYRLEKQAIVDALNDVHPNVKRVFGLDYDPVTGIGQQKVDPMLKTWDEVKDLVKSERAYNIGQDLDNAAKVGASVVVDADTNISGATSRIGEKTLAITGFGKTADGDVFVQGFNEDGHFAKYFLDERPALDGETSKINSFIRSLNQEHFRGEIANVYLGPRDFNIDDILRTEPRAEAITTRESMALVEPIARALNETDIAKISPKVAKVMENINNNKKAVRIDDLYELRDLLTVDKRALQIMCSILGKLNG